MDTTTPRIKVYIISPNDRPYLQLQWTDPASGRRVTRSTKTRDPEEGERMRAGREYELARGIAAPAGGPGPAGMTWAEFRAVYEARRLSRNRPGTRKRAAEIFAVWEASAKPGLLSAITEAHVARFTEAASGGRAASTVITYLNYLGAALRWAKKKKYMREVPEIERPPAPPAPPIRVVTGAELARLLAACPSPCWRLYLHVLWHTGLRLWEGRCLSWGGDGVRLDLGAAKVIIPGQDSKGGKDSWLPLHPGLLRLLRAVPARVRRAGGRVCPGVTGSGSAISTRFRGVAGRAGVDCTLHDLRRTFGSRYAVRVAPAVLMRLMRHATIQTTMRYYVNVDASLDEAIRLA